MRCLFNVSLFICVEFLSGTAHRNFQCLKSELKSRIKIESNDFFVHDFLVNSFALRFSGQKGTKMVSKWSFSSFTENWPAYLFLIFLPWIGLVWRLKTKCVHDSNHAHVVNAIALTVHDKLCVLFQFKKNRNLFWLM